MFTAKKVIPNEDMLTGFYNAVILDGDDLAYAATIKRILVKGVVKTFAVPNQWVLGFMSDVTGFTVIDDGEVITPTNIK